MDTSSLNQQIETAVAIEAKEGHLANYLIDRAHERGVILADEQRDDALELFENYIRSVPKLLGAASESAKGTPVETIMAKVMRAAVHYWDEPDDLVPDALGVLGLLDDAYFSLRLLQLVSQRLEAEAGRPLIAEDLSALDAIVRDILGDHLAEVLDELVILTLSNAPIDELIETLDAHSGSFILPSAETSFAGLSVDTLVEERLGFASGPSDSLRPALAAVLEQLAAKLEGRLNAGEALTRDDALIRDASAALSQELTAAFVAGDDEAGEEDDSLESDIETAVALLAGATLQRVLLGSTVDRHFIAETLDFVLAGLS